MQVKTLLQSVTTLLFSGALTAQDQQLPCGVGAHDGHHIKEKMLRQREMPILPRSSAITYVPVTVHLVGTDEGLNYPPEFDALQAICRLNDTYASQNVQFYLAGGFHYLPNSEIYGDGYGWAGMSEMENAKVPGTANIFVGTSVSEPVAGYYSPWADFVFVRRNSIGYFGTTLTHEMGHFFTLPHTFYGWEGIDCEQEYGSSVVPTSIDGWPVEYVARTGSSANCASAADGFCDTEADYYSYRQNCPVYVTVMDPDSVLIDPNEHYYMSYLSDACMDSFSTEQKAAIWADITQRGWANNPLPAGLDPLPDSIAWQVSPAPGTTLTVDAQQELRWHSVPGATHYFVELYRTWFGSPIETLVQFSTTDTAIGVAAGLFQENRPYAWRITPYNFYHVCQPRSQYFTFNTDSVINTGVVGMDTDAWKLVVSPNPVGDAGYWTVECLEATQGDLYLYSSDGQLRRTWRNLELQAGENRWEWMTGDLANGLYILVLDTPERKMYQKVIVNR